MKRSKRPLRSATTGCAIIMLALLVALVTAPQTRADTLHVPGDYATIQAALDAAAQTGDEIIVAPGDYNEAINLLGKEVYLHSSDGRDVTTIDGTGLNTSVVTCVSGETSETIIEGFTITGGSGTRVGIMSYGGGMIISNSNPTISTCRFTDNGARQGGGMFIQSGNPTIDGCDFSDNQARSGGGIYNRDSGNATIANCDFNDNSAAWDGGGVYNEQASPVFKGCRWIGNTAKRRGGGICNINRSSPTIDDGAFERNSADGAGGGVFNRDFCNPKLTNCRFELNEARSGGGMYSYDYCNASLMNCTFTGNSAVEGGAIRNHRSSPTLVKCMFYRNSATGSGGAMYNVMVSSPTLTDCNFIRNKAGRSGGAMSNNSHCEPLLFNCDFIKNSADRYGGALYNYNEIKLDLTDCRIVGNSAGSDGGGIHYTGSARFRWTTLVHCTVQGNTADDEGGGIHDPTRRTILRDTKVCGNLPDQIPHDWRDEGGNCVTDLCEDCPTAKLSVSPDPLIAGQIGTFRMKKGTPNEIAYLAYSLAGLGSTYLPDLQVTLDLDRPILVSKGKVTNGNGLVVHNIMVPLRAIGRDVWFQAVQFQLKTNTVKTRVVQ